MWWLFSFLLFQDILFSNAHFFQFICIFCIQYFQSLISIYTLIIFARGKRYCLKNCPSCFSGSSITYSKILMNSFHHLCMPRGKECERCFLIQPCIEWFNPCLITLSSLFSLLIFVTFNIFFLSRRLIMTHVRIDQIWIFLFWHQNEKSFATLILHINSYKHIRTV